MVSSSANVTQSFSADVPAVLDVATFPKAAREILAKGIVNYLAEKSDVPVDKFTIGDSCISRSYEFLKPHNSVSMDVYAARKVAFINLQIHIGTFRALYNDDLTAIHASFSSRQLFGASRPLDLIGQELGAFPHKVESCIHYDVTPITRENLAVFSASHIEAIHAGALSYAKAGGRGKQSDEQIISQAVRAAVRNFPDPLRHFFE